MHRVFPGLTSRWLLNGCRWIPLLIVAGTLLPTSGLEAQLRLLPQVGMYAPVADLGELRDETGQLLLDLGRRSSTLAFGLDVELGGPGSGVGLRVGLGYASSSDVPIDGVGCPDCSARSSLATAGAAVVLRPLPRLVVARPYFLLGGGVLWYDFEDDDLRDAGWSDVLENQRRGQLGLGVGTTFFLGIIEPQVELRAHIAGLELGDGPGPEASSSVVTGRGDRQTNLFLVVSIPLGG